MGVLGVLDCPMVPIVGIQQTHLRGRYEKQKTNRRNVGRKSLGDRAGQCHLQRMGWRIGVGAWKWSPRIRSLLAVVPIASQRTILKLCLFLMFLWTFVSGTPRQTKAGIYKKVYKMWIVLIKRNANNTWHRRRIVLLCSNECFYSGWNSRVYWFGIVFSFIAKG